MSLKVSGAACPVVYMFEEDTDDIIKKRADELDNIMENLIAFARKLGESELVIGFYKDHFGNDSEKLMTDSAKINELLIGFRESIDYGKKLRVSLIASVGEIDSSLEMQLDDYESLIIHFLEKNCAYIREPLKVNQHVFKEYLLGVLRHHEALLQDFVVRIDSSTMQLGDINRTHADDHSCDWKEINSGNEEIESSLEATRWSITMFRKENESILQNADAIDIEEIILSLSKQKNLIRFLENYFKASDELVGLSVDKTDLLDISQVQYADTPTELATGVFGPIA